MENSIPAHSLKSYPNLASNITPGPSPQISFRRHHKTQGHSISSLDSRYVGERKHMIHIKITKFLDAQEDDLGQGSKEEESGTAERRHS